MLEVMDIPLSMIYLLYTAYRYQNITVQSTNMHNCHQLKHLLKGLCFTFASFGIFIFHPY
jgi:hypothetical protein